MADLLVEVEGLLPCPFCGNAPEVTEQRYTVSLMDGKSSLLTVTIGHHCTKLKGCVNAHIAFRGRDHESAINQWNKRMYV